MTIASEHKFAGPVLRTWLMIMATCLSSCSPSATSSRPSTPSDNSDTISEGFDSRSNSSLLHPHFDFLEIESALPASEFRDGSEIGLFSLPETTGGGLAILDLDRDGRFDLVCSGGGIPDPLGKRMIGYRGTVFRGIEPFRFAECSSSTRVDLSGSYNSAIVAADYDNDGFTDFLATGFDSAQLFHNQGDGTFSILPVIEEAIWSSGGAFFDADNDGDVDLYVTHYADWSFDKNPFCPSRDNGSKRDYCGPSDFRGLQDAFYENLGDGNFENRTDDFMSDVRLRGLGVIAADLDEDRDCDLYVANDVEQNLLYRNEGGSKTTEMGRRSGVAGDDKGRPEGSMGVAIGDYNLDGKFDLWVTNYQNEVCALYRNNGNMSFTYASNSARIAATDELSVGWGTAFTDIDLDGDEDLLVINGHLEKYSTNYLQRPQALENVEGKFFRLRPFPSKYFNTPQAGRGLALADFDRDGRVDFCVTRVNDTHTLIRNTTVTTGHYLSLNLIGTQSNRDAIGTTVRLSIGQRTFIRQVYGGGSYASTSDRRIHFGIPETLAASTGIITIVWPSGRDESRQVTRWDEELRIVEGQ